MAAFALGSVLGGVGALGRQPARPLLVAALGTLLFPLPVAALALGEGTALVAGAALLGGIGSAAFNIFFEATIQREVPAELQARVVAFDIVGAYSAGPIAFAAAGPLAALVGAHLLLGVGAGWSLLGSLVVLAVPAVRGLRPGAVVRDGPGVAPR